ncbi:chorismate mutase [Afifella sp. H1R]|uniref:chorismate mutase n=1 Tax=Afifella sp. H1R TaxID=2908841 RepID=UPI001F184A70|nr:chorismate mutase [Afifella sp. H1R]MCF1505436.1 chorismate mutase [Afifella sp. H1R]
MSAMAPDALAKIRQRIDHIDEEVHRLLIERSAVIDELIHIKGTSAPGAAFRPDREAHMMRALVMRHEGILPLATVEHIWREVISTFTAMQAPFRILIGQSTDPAALQDLVRFQFGFSVPAEAAASDADALAALRRDGDLIAILSPHSPGRWWRNFDGEDLQIFARLPFIIAPNHPVQAEAYVAGPKLSVPPEADIRLWRMHATGAFEKTLSAFNARIVTREGDEILVEISGAISYAALQEEAEKRGATFSEPVELGSFAAPIHFVGQEEEQTEEDQV